MIVLPCAFLFLLIHLNSLVFAQKKTVKLASLDGFWGIKFGTYQHECKKILASNPNIISVSQDNDSKISVGIDSFAGHKVSVIELLFIEQRFSGSRVIFETEGQVNEFELYKEIQKEIDSKYLGKTLTGEYGDKSSWRFRPRQDPSNDKMTVWMFKKTSDLSNSICLIFEEITRKVSLLYLHTNKIDKHQMKLLEDY
ncbi:MAG: hypothetical protein H9535_00775 [Ignavibacteria bacterium]|nr:hypothetical protein [Ignavibacteria bacterium]